MEKQIAYCGLVCSDCDAFIATQNNDDRKRQEIAEKWAREYKYPFKVEDINCDGCVSTGKHIGHWNMCRIRICGQEKGVKNCGWCDDYPCDKTDEFFKMAPDCKKALDAIRQSRK